MSKRRRSERPRGSGHPLPRRPIREGLPLLALAGMAVWAAQAHASAFQLCEQSEESVGTACVGQALGTPGLNDAADNPASLLEHKRPTLAFGARILALDAKFGSNIAPAQGGGIGGDAGAPVPLMSIHAAVPLNSRFAAGISFTSPFGLGVKYDHGWMGRYYDEKAALKTFDATTGLAARVNDRITIGGALIAQYAELRYRRAIDNALDGLSDGGLYLRLNDWAFGYGAGLIVRLTQHLRLGISYRSAISQRFAGAADFTNVGPTLAALGVGGTRAKLDQRFPQQVMADIAFNPRSNVELIAEGGWVNWSVLKETKVTFNSGYVDVTPRNWHDTYRIGGSARWRVTPKLTAMAGVSFDSSPTGPHERLPDIAVDRQWKFGVGAEVKMSPRTRLTAAYGYDNLGSNRIVADLNPLTGPLDGGIPQTLQVGGVELTVFL